MVTVSILIYRRLHVTMVIFSILTYRRLPVTLVTVSILTYLPQVTCNYGYRSMGEETVTCQTDGEWSGELECEKILCPQYPVLYKGTYSIQYEIVFSIQGVG